jgi:hypothetical protein
MTTKNQLNRLKGRYLDKTFVTEIPNTLDDRDGCFRLRLTIVDIKFVKRINKVEKIVRCPLCDRFICTESKDYCQPVEERNEKLLCNPSSVYGHPNVTFTVT